jgi:hypothetical protein
MWWRGLVQAPTVSVRPPDAPRRIGEELVWDDLEIRVRFELDADLIGVAPGEWWRDGPSRLREILAAPRYQPAPGHRVTIIDEAACRRR